MLVIQVQTLFLVLRDKNPSLLYQFSNSAITQYISIIYLCKQLPVFLINKQKSWSEINFWFPLWHHQDLSWRAGTLDPGPSAASPAQCRAQPCRGRSQQTITQNTFDIISTLSSVHGNNYYLKGTAINMFKIFLFLALFLETNEKEMVENKRSEFLNVIFHHNIPFLSSSDMLNCALAR